MRLPRPVALDLRAIADGVIRNNMGLGGIELRVRGRLAGAVAVLDGTGQRLPVAGELPTSADGWLWLEAREFGLGERDDFGWLGSSRDPLGPPVPGKSP